MALFTEGKLFKKAGEGSGGGGGGDQHNLGWYATQSALEEAHPTATAGDWAIVGATDTVWIWDTDTSAWKDSDQKGQVTSVNNKTGAVVLDASDVDAIPQYSTMPTATAEMAGNIVQFTGTTDANYTNGYFYKCVSDGQTPATYSWTAVQVQAGGGGNYLPITGGTLEGELLMGSDPITSKRYAINFGNGAYLKAYNTFTLMLSYDGTHGTIYFDGGSGAITPSNDASYHTLGKSNLRWNNVYTTKLNNGADIIIPTTGGTMAVVNTPSTMPTLAVADWSNNTQTVNVTGVTATNTVFVSPAPASAADYASAGIVCTAQGAGTLTFTCTTTPTNAITVNVVCL
jgi:hypothetical protein